MNSYIDMERQYGANNYAPLPVVLKRGDGVYLWDVDDKRYLDMMSAYSAVSHGHANPELLKTFIEQAQNLAVTSRAFYNEKLPELLKLVCEKTAMDKALPMNTGAEAVETAIKVVRKWAYQVKGVPGDKAEIITCASNFHGRTMAVISFSTEAQYKEGFGPFLPGMKTIPFNDVAALEAAITPNTAAFLVEPIQGEGGIIIPDDGYLKACQQLCQQHNVLLICDEVQTGLGRTGKFLASQHDEVQPDGLILGKALGGGLYPVSMFLARDDVMSVLNPGDHGSTFGGNALAAAVATRALTLFDENDLCQHSADLGRYFMTQLKNIKSDYIKAIRGKGLFIALEIEPAKASAREICLQLLERGVLSKETHDTVVRLAPPLIITQEQIDDCLAIIAEVLN